MALARSTAKRGWVAVSSSALKCLTGVLWAVPACSFTARDFDPVRVEVGAAQPPLPDAAGNVTGDSDAGGSGPVECNSSECMPMPGLLVPTCSDEVQNAGEAGVDCGRVCPNACGVGSSCELDADCGSGSCRAGRCEPPGCDDQAQNQDETGIDCGGDTCERRCAEGAGCSEDDDCASQVCSPAGACAAPSCGDGALNQDETDEDCGGSCEQKCGTGDACVSDADCQSQVCGGFGCGPFIDDCCQPPTCQDGIANGGEPVPDCGNLRCGLCELGVACIANQNCESGFCDDNVCRVAPTCTDQTQNGDEPFTDCGGSDPACPRCADRLPCFAASDCANNNCFEGVCISCGSLVQDGTETDIDCGGTDPACRRCNPGERCVVGSDCAGGQCFGGFC